MKKNFLFASAMMFAASAVFFTGCKKTSDTTPPVVTLNGFINMMQSLPATAGTGTFIDPGATAYDDEEGVVKVAVTGTVDPNTKGAYTLTYSATDAAGNSSAKKRTVTIVNDAEVAGLAGVYSVKDSVYTPSISVTTYTDTVTASPTVNNRIWVAKFGKCVNGVVYLDRTSAMVINCPSQTITCGSPAASKTFVNSSAPGTIAASSPIVLVLDYRETVTGPPSSTSQAIARYTHL